MVMSSQSAAPARPPRRPLVWPTLAMLPALVLLIGLGTWQLQRKAWKEGLIAKIEARVTTTPIPLTDALTRYARGEDVEFLPVAVPGRFQRERSLFYYAPGTGGPGFEVFAPLLLEAPAGTIDTLIVNRGFVPEGERAAAARPSPTDAALREVTGLVRLPPKPGRFTPDNDVAHNLWFWPDVQAMTRAAYSGETRQSPPFYLAEVQELSRQAAAAPGVPRPGHARIELPNRHLEYALTWYAFAVSLLGVYVIFIRGRLRAEKARPAGSGRRSGNGG